MKKSLIGLITASALALFISLPVAAEPGHAHGDMKANHHQMMKSDGHGDGHHAMKKDGPMAGHGAKHKGHGKKGMHMFTPMWMTTLTDEQKLSVDKMHLDVAKKQKLIKAKMKVAKMELRLLSIAEKPDMNAINAKVDEIAKFKAEKMKVRYAHIVEMREILTPQQRISYDMSILNHKKKGKGKHH